MLGGPQANNQLAERVRKLFGTVPCRLQVAALPWRIGEAGVEILLITSRDTGRWVLPKGWPEAREPLSEAAAREAQEEAGLAGAISHIEAGRYFYAKALGSGQEVPCEVLVYPLLVAEMASKWKERHQRARRWFAGGEAAGMVAEPDLGAIIAAFAADPGRYDILCQKLVQEQLYTTAAVLTSSRSAATSGDFADMSELTSLKTS